MTDLLYIILGTILGWAFTLSGVALGGHIVFRTKREAYEGSLFSKLPQGTATIIGGPDEVSMDDLLQKSSARIPPIPDAISAANNSFITQFGERIRKEAAKAGVVNE